MTLSHKQFKQILSHIKRQMEWTFNVDKYTGSLQVSGVATIIQKDPYKEYFTIHVHYIPDGKGSMNTIQFEQLAKSHFPYIHENMGLVMTSGAIL